MAKINVDKYVYQVDIDADNPGSIPITIGLEKGDILVYRGTGYLERLPVGADGQVLTADSDSELGVSWADPA